MKGHRFVSALVSIVLASASSAFAEPEVGAEPVDESPPAGESGATSSSSSSPPREPETKSGLERATPSTAETVERPVSSGGRPPADVVRINLGARVGYLPVGLVGYLPSRAFDTFASNDVLSQFSIDGTYPVLASHAWALGVGLGWDIGGREDHVRGLASSLVVHRLYVPIEGRVHLSRGLFAFAKLSPGVVAALASVQDPSAPNELSATGWAFSTDVSIGGSILLGPHQHPEKRVVRLWLTPEIGYAYTTKAPLHVNPDRADKDLLGRDEDTNLGKLAFSGIFARATIGVTF